MKTQEDLLAITAFVTEPWLDNAKAHYEKYKEDPEEGVNRMYECFTLTPPNQSGDSRSQSHHSSLLTVFNHAVGFVTEKYNADFRQYLIDQYYVADHRVYTQENAAYQVDELLTKYASGSLNEPGERRDQFLSFDETFLESLPSTTQMPDSPDPVNITPRDFLEKVFSPVVLQYSKNKVGHIATQHQTVQKATLFNWDSNNTPDLEKEVFVSRSIYKKGTLDLAPSEKTRSKANLAATPYLVLECDLPQNMREKFTTFALLMSEYAPLTAIIDSGNKSLHFWFAAHGTDKTIIEHFASTACRFGADRSVVSDRTKLVRMPNVAANEEGRGDQKLIYFNESTTHPTSPFVRWDLAGFESEIDDIRETEIYYYNSKGKYYRKDDRGFWMPYSDDLVKTTLELLGYRSAKVEGEIVSPLREKLDEITSGQCLDTVLERVAGYGSGLMVTKDGSRHLITKGFAWPEYKGQNAEVAFPNIDQFIGELFDGIERDVFIGWLADSVQSAWNNGAATSKIGKQSQYLNIVGDAGAGKTFLSNFIMRPLLGGEMVDGSPLFTEEQFNSEQFASILLVLDDSEVLKPSESGRALQGERIKNCLVGSTGSLHGKHKDRVSIKPFWRIVRLLNESKLDTLPPMDVPDVASKVIILRARNRGEEKGELWADTKLKQFENEMSDFFTYLVNHQIPDHVRPEVNRFAVISHHNADIMESVTESSAESYLLRIIDRGIIEPNFNDYFQQGATVIYDTLLAALTSDDRRRFEKIFSTPTKLGKALRWLAENEPNRVQSTERDTCPMKRGMSKFQYRLKLP